MTEDVAHPVQYRNLYRAVLYRAVADALDVGTSEGHNRGHSSAAVARDSARTWFRSSNPDFLTICEYAEIDHKMVLRTMAELVKIPTVRKGRARQMILYTGAKPLGVETKARKQLHEAVVSARLRLGIAA